MNAWTWALIGVCAVVAAWAALLCGLVLAGRSAAAREIAAFVPDCLVLLRRLLADRRMPRRRKLLLFALVAYLAMPFDLVPDFIPVAGQLDDALLVAWALRAVLRADPALVREHWPGSPAGLAAIMRLAGT